MNKIREHRHKLKLTQKGLADLLGTTRQHVQRIEVGEKVKVDLAFRICAALKQPIEVIYPGTKKAIARIKKNGLDKIGKSDPETDRLMYEAGIDVDPMDWTVDFKIKTVWKDSGV